MVRVRAVPLPGSLVSALEQHTEVVKRLVSAAQHSTHQQPQHITVSGTPQPDGQLHTETASQHTMPEQHTIPGTQQPNRQPHIGVVQEHEAQAVNQAEPMQPQVDPGEAAFRSQLSSAVKGAGQRCKALLPRAWQLGPKGSGPNILLLPPNTGRGCYHPTQVEVKGGQRGRLEGD